VAAADDLAGAERHGPPVTTTPTHAVGNPEHNMHKLVESDEPVNQYDDQWAKEPWG
jgi:hypothetical protein